MMMISKLLPQSILNFPGATDPGCNDQGLNPEELESHEGAIGTRFRSEWSQFQEVVKSYRHAGASKHWNSGQNNTVKLAGDNKSSHNPKLVERVLLTNYKCMAKYLSDCQNASGIMDDWGNVELTSCSYWCAVFFRLKCCSSCERSNCLRLETPLSPPNVSNL